MLQGKLLIVYEGHWSRVHYLMKIEKNDILISAADSNIKVWDL